MKNPWLAKQRLKTVLEKSHVFLHLVDYSTNKLDIQKIKFDIQIIFKLQSRAIMTSIVIADEFTNCVYITKTNLNVTEYQIITLRLDNILIDGVKIGDLFKTS